MEENEELKKIDGQIEFLGQQLEHVLTELGHIREREVANRGSKESAMGFVEKAEQVIRLAEEGKIFLNDEQRIKIRSTLASIMKLFNS